MARILALALAAAVSMVSMTPGFAKSRHHHHGAAMTVKNVKGVNNPTPTRHDPPGTRTNCRGGCL